MAVKVTLVPVQIVEELAVILMLGVELGFTVISNELDVTKVGVAQFAFDVISTDITSLFANPLVIYVFELLPTLVPFFFH